MGFGVCAMTAVPAPAQASAINIAATGRASRKTCRTMATPPPDATGPVEANESTGAVGKAGERRKVGNVIASVVDKETDKIARKRNSSFYNAEILSPSARALRHLWQNAPLHQPGKRVRAAYSEMRVKCAVRKALDEPAG
jgi:hypothetical protein